MKRGPLVVVFIFIILVSGTLFTLYYHPKHKTSEIVNEANNEAAPFSHIEKGTLADQHEIQGVLDPVVIEQTGNSTIGPLHAETDSKTNVKTNLFVDVANNWMGGKASVNLWNLKRLYIENGSFTEGIVGDNLNPTGSVANHPYGWDATSYSPTVDVEMHATYSNQEVTTWANGDRVGQNYFYANGSYVYWTQTVNNTPYLENFVLNFDYFYDRGPVENSNVSLQVLIDDELIWNVTTESILTSMWYNTGNMPLNLTGIGNQFDFKIGLYFSADVLYQFQFIRFVLDNIQFFGNTTPSFDDASIALNIGQESTVITGGSNGAAFMVNESYWKTENVLIELTAPLSYSFDYTATMSSSRLINSTKSLSQFNDGVLFTSQLNGPPLIEFYTFLGVWPDIDNFTLIIRMAKDWENATVYNPYGTLVTSSCEITPGKIVIPTSQLSSLGWWEIHMDSPNYIRSLQTLKLNEPLLDWFPASVFRSSNITKAFVEIGGTTPFSTPLQDANFTWIMPSGSKWFTESTSGGANGKINSTQLEFGPTNATAGIWQIVVFWTNGTELAYGSTSFEVHHRAVLFPQRPIIPAESGLSISSNVIYQDAENDQFLMDPTTSITANWSSTTVTFLPVLTNNSWVGVFDTSLVEPGNNLVVVNASRPFFDDIYCTFVIEFSYTDNQLMIDTQNAEIGIGDTYNVNFNYTDAFGTGLSEADVNIYFEGPPDGVSWTEVIDIGSGDYSVEFKAVHSGTYEITISASKEFYEEARDTLVILVGSRGSVLSIENGSAAIINFGEQYRLVLRYENNTGFGLDEANVIVISVTPETGLNYTTAINEGNGYYSFLLSPTNTETYTLLIQASFIDHTIERATFTLKATAISSQLRITGASTPASVGVAQPFELLIFYEQTGGTPANITMATLQVNFTSYESLNYIITPLAEGYLISFQTDQIGSYEFIIYASKPGFQDDFQTFTLIVRARGMKVIMDPLVWIRLSDLNITLKLVEVDTDLPITDANVSYRLLRTLGPVMEGYLDETSPGVYSIFIRPDWGTGTGYSILIFVEKENYALDQDYEFVVIQTTPQDIALQILVQTYLPPIIGIAAVSIVSLSGRMVYRRKKKAEFEIDLMNKRRFEDADNIIGVIVMHKRSGIPIYSRIVKGGFEEGIVAAFISAVTQFREEFEMLEEEAMKVIPISDIIRAVQTENLICAFVTVRSASIEHNRKMEAFGIQVAIYLDDFYTESRPPSFMDERITEILDYVYDETMDGNLLKFHKIADSKKLTKRYQSIEQVILDMESAHCSRPIYLAKAVSKYGVSEAHGCTLVSEAIEKQLLIPCEADETPDTEIDLVKFLDNGRHEKGD